MCLVPFAHYNIDLTYGECVLPALVVFAYNRAQTLCTAFAEQPRKEINSRGAAGRANQCDVLIVNNPHQGAGLCTVDACAGEGAAPAHAAEAAAMGSEPAGQQAAVPAHGGSCGRAALRPNRCQPDVLRKGFAQGLQACPDTLADSLHVSCCFSAVMYCVVLYYVECYPALRMKAVTPCPAVTLGNRLWGSVPSSLLSRA